MLYIDSIWEYIVNFLELALFIIFIHKKLRIRANYKHQAVLMFLFVSFQFAVLCTLNKMGISSYSTLMSSCVLDIGYAVLFYRDSIIRRIFWGFSYSIICLVAEQISFFIPVTLYKGAPLELLLGGTLRKPYTMLYLAMIAVFVLLFHSIGNKDISLSPFQKVAYIFIAISGLAIGHYILRLTLESVDKFGDSSFSARLSLVDLFFIILFLLYKIIPDVHVHIFDIVKGAFCSSILMLILLSALEFYFSIADYTSVYGPLASVVVIMISFSLIAETIFIGMYIMFEAHMKRLIIEMKKNNHS